MTDIKVTVPGTAHGKRVATALLTLVALFVGRLAQAQRERRDIEHLMKLDDCYLKDIGIARCEIDFRLLDRKVDELGWKLAMTMPDCTTKTLESMRKHKLEHWHRNREPNRAWLALNMATEGKAGFPAFHFGPKGDREVDFLALRRALADGREWSDELIREVSPQYRQTLNRETVS